MTEPYTYPTQGTPPAPYPAGSYAPSRPGRAGLVPIAGGIAAGIGLVGAMAFFFFGFGTHVETFSVSGGSVQTVPVEGYETEPLPEPGPQDLRVTTPLLAAAEAESSYRGEHGSFTGAMSDLRAFSYLPAKGIRVEALTADVDRFCLRGTDGHVTWYVSSDDSTQVSSQSCA